MRKQTEPWWRQAQADFQSGEFLLPTRQSYAVSWFAQQAVEKGLKALYFEQRAILPPRVHDLEYLATEVALPAGLMPDVALINPTFALVRYPNPAQAIAPIDLITEERATQHFEAARRVLQWLEQQLSVT
jgi:HEPN domain-containing protein